MKSEKMTKRLQKKRFNVILLGSMESGKSSIINRIIFNSFTMCMMGTTSITDYKMKFNDDNRAKKDVYIVDSPGNQRYRSSYLYLIKHFDCILIAFDANNKKEKEEIIYFYEEYKKWKNKSAQLIFVANKVKNSNIYRQYLWPKEERINFINNLMQVDEDCIEIDCKENYNINELKELILIYSQYEKKLQQIINLKKLKKREIKNKCV